MDVPKEAGLYILQPSTNVSPWCRHRKTQPQNDLQRRSPRKIPHASSGDPETAVIMKSPSSWAKVTHKRPFSKEDQIDFPYQTTHIHLEFTW